MARADLCAMDAVDDLSFSPLIERRRAWTKRMTVSLFCLDRKISHKGV